MTGRAVALGPALLIQTRASDGDVGRDAPGAQGRWTTLVGRPWTTAVQVHGRDVITVEGPVSGPVGEADGIVTAASDTPIAMFGADCALVAFSSPEGVIGVAHAGWRGLAAGIIPAEAASMRSLGASALEVAVSPMIHPECYEFGAADLDAVAALLGDRVRATTSSGAGALDLPSGVSDALDRVGAVRQATLGGCTAHEEGWFSFRARRQTERHALVLWRPGQ
jgi:YfiH family protein